MRALTTATLLRTALVSDVIQPFFTTCLDVSDTTFVVAVGTAPRDRHHAVGTTVTTGIGVAVATGMGVAVVDIGTAVAFAT